jgi:iron complex outermembrane receptor protein
MYGVIKQKNLFILLAAAQVFDAAAGEAAAKALDEMVVTAQKKQESIQEAQVSLTAFSTDELESMRAFNVADLSAFAPNVQVLASPASSANIGASIRGISSGDPALDPKIGLYLDGVYLARNTGAVFDIVDLERVEVLRGPQGTLWGKNATGGAISLITTVPGDDFYFKQSLSAGSDQYWRARTTIDAPISDSLKTKLSAIRSESGGWASNHAAAAPSDLASDDTTAWRAALRWIPTENLIIDYSYDVQRQNAIPKPLQLLVVNPAAVSPPSLVPGVENPYSQAAPLASPHRRLESFNLDFVDEERVEVGGYNFTLAWEMDDIQLKSITARRYYKADNRGTDSDGGSFSSALYHELSRKKQNQFSQEFQLIGVGFDQRLDYVLGLFYFDERAGEDTSQLISIMSDFDNDGRPDGALPLAALGIVLPFHYEIANKSTAAYGQMTYAPAMFDDRINFTAGVRYTEDEKTASLRNSTILAEERGSNTWSKVTYTLGAQVFLADNVNIFGKFATGYNAGQFNLRASTAAAFRVPADEENIRSFELGFKSDLLERRFRLNLAAFYNNYNDLQVTQFMADQTGASSVLSNAGEATAQGIELEATALLTDSLELALRYGYVDMDYDKYIDGDGRDISGIAKPPYTPAHTGSASLQYRFAPFSFGNLSARMDVSYSDGYTFNPVQDIYANAGSRTLVDARLDLADLAVFGGTSRVSLWVKNVEDKEYREWGIDFGVAGGALPFAGATYGDPRSYGIDFVYEY